MAQRGRKTKYTPPTVARIVQAIELGATYRLACQIGGISHETFNQWMNTKPEFLEAIRGAEGKMGLTGLAQMQRAAAEGNIAATKWLLERRFPEDYGRTIQDVNATVAGEVITKLVRKG